MEKKFIDGLYVDVKTTQYGDIIKLSFNYERFNAFMKQNMNEKGYINVDILETKKGKKYAVLNEFKPQQSATQSTVIDNEPEGDDLPF